MYSIIQLVLIASFPSLCLSFFGSFYSSNQCPAPYINGNRKLEKLTTKASQPIAILGAPFWKGQKQMGTELAPNLFRDQNIVYQILRLGFQNVVDYGDIQFVDNPKDKKYKTNNNFTEIHNQYTLSDANKLMESSVEAILRKRETLVILGGDHSVTAGAILGNAKVNPDVCVIYVDAHGDLNNCETTTSGNLHGMPLSFVIKGMEILHKNFKSCPAMSALIPTIPASNVVSIAIRDLDDSELDVINQFQLRHYSMKDIDEIGIIGTVNQILNTVCKSKPIHISFDIDSIDVSYAPNTGTSVVGGLTMREALQLAEMIAQTNRLTVIEMYEVNPREGPALHVNSTVNYAMNIILAFLGKSRETNWALPWEGGWGRRAK